MDGAGKSLQDLIQFSTIPDVSVRFSSVDDFLRALDEVEDELTAPDPEKTVIAPARHLLPLAGAAPGGRRVR